jgi:GDPmannose 4,6-dehydratase
VASKSSAFIAGINGQDGAHLADHLLKLGYKVYGGSRTEESKMWRLDCLGIKDRIDFVEFHLEDYQNIADLFKNIQPNEIYNLAGESFVSNSFLYPNHTMKINTQGTVNILEAAKISSPYSKIFIASSSEIFGQNKKGDLLNEKSAKKPANPYAISKLSADYFVKLYRDHYGLFACSGILFNHEGPLRSRQFVTRKITHNIARIKLGEQEGFELGNFSSARDWGAAVDFVKAMHLMLQSDQPNDYVIATGKLTEIRQVIEIAANFVGLDPVFDGYGDKEICIDKKSGSILASVSPDYYRPFDTVPIIGDATLINKALGWSPDQNVEQVIHSMVKADLCRGEKGLLYI